VLLPDEHSYGGQNYRANEESNFEIIDQEKRGFYACIKLPVFLIDNLKVELFFVNTAESVQGDPSVLGYQVRRVFTYAARKLWCE
jgi:hypothetical protein